MNIPTKNAKNESLISNIFLVIYLPRLVLRIVNFAKRRATEIKSLYDGPRNNIKQFGIILKYKLHIDLVIDLG